jgi:hypothetical protein
VAAPSVQTPFGAGTGSLYHSLLSHWTQYTIEDQEFGGDSLADFQDIKGPRLVDQAPGGRD